LPSICACSDAQRKKLDAKSIKCVYLGVSEESKAYRLYDPVNKKVIVSRDVVFEEGVSWNWDDKKQKAQVTNDDTNSEIADVDLLNHDNITGEGSGVSDNCVGDSSRGNQSHSGDESEQEANDYETEEELPPRVSKRPPYLQDYVTDLDTEEQEQVNNLAIFSSNEDPTTYDEASKHEIWR
jgi:hypothetical protein